nr:cation transporter [uncultured Friedmanniella sp.]
MSVSFGDTELPQEQMDALRRAVRLEWVTVGFLVVAVTVVGLVLGNSQAMKAAWVEDLLSFAPPIAFLVAVRIIRRPPSRRWPYGLHRSVGVAHLVSGVALAAMGLFLIIDSASGLLRVEHPPIGSVKLFGQVFWLGWLMIAAMVLTGVPPVFLGRAKMKLAPILHDKVLYADAAMNKADWLTALGSIVGVLGIGIGWWWADAAAALFISGSILHDGITNLRAAVTDLMDARATTFDDAQPHPLIEDANQALHELPWVADAGSRVRDEGHVFHVESFVVPRPGANWSLAALDEAATVLRQLDWKLRDVVVAPVATLPKDVRSPTKPS